MPPETLACRQFLNADQPFEIYPYGNGLINDTFLVNVAAAKPWRFILQRINTEIFAHPEQLMHNLLVIGEHIRRKAGCANSLQIPGVLETAAGQLFYCDTSGQAWRALSFIADSKTLDGIATIDQALQTGMTLGQFHRMTCDLPGDALYDTLPGFHITTDYWWQYKEALANPDKPDVCAAFEFCAEFIAARQGLIDILEDAKRRGILQQRIIHGDPKLDNFLFDQDDRRILGIIDLDTVKPGLIHYDIGDCLRSCCRKGEPAHFDVSICEALLHGYLQEAWHFMTSADYAFLYPAIQLLPFELGLRFFTDYLNGNRYFKVDDPQQNLRRAIDQFDLVESIEAQQDRISGVLDRLRESVEISPIAN